MANSINIVYSVVINVVLNDIRHLECCFPFSDMSPKNMKMEVLCPSLLVSVPKAASEASFLPNFIMYIQSILFYFVTKLTYFGLHIVISLSILKNLPDLLLKSSISLHSVVML